MALEISSEVLDRIVEEAGRFRRREVCGLLFGASGAVTGSRSCRNIAAEPATSFEIDPAQLIAAHRAARAGGPRIVGCYHSHPGGSPVPSARDAAAAAPDGTIWLIAVGREIGAWRAVANGRVEGRFDPVEHRRVAATATS